MKVASLEEGGALPVSADVQVAAPCFNRDVDPGRWIGVSVTRTGAVMRAGVAKRASEPVLTTKGVTGSRAWAL